MSLPAAAVGAYQQSSYATVLMTAVTGATRIPVRTAPLGSSPAAHLTPACSKTKCAMDEPTAQTNGTRAGSCVARTSLPLRRRRHVLRQSFSVATENASAMCGGVTTHLTALMAAMRKIAVSIGEEKEAYSLKLLKIWVTFLPLLAIKEQT